MGDQNTNIVHIQQTIQQYKLPYIINVAGILYDLNNTNDTSYISRGIRSFLKDFKPIKLNKKSNKGFVTESDNESDNDSYNDLDNDSDNDLDTLSNNTISNNGFVTRSDNDSDTSSNKKKMSQNTKKLFNELEFTNDTISIHYILYILSKYFNPDISKENMLKMLKKNKCDNTILTIILRERARKIYNTIRFNKERYNGYVTNHRVVANIPYEKSHHDILSLIGDITQIEPETVHPNDRKRIISVAEEIPNNYFFNLILELSWMLHHPESSPHKINNITEQFMKQFIDNIRIIDVITMIKEYDSHIAVLPHNYNKHDEIEQRLLTLIHIYQLSTLLDNNTPPPSKCTNTMPNIVTYNHSSKGGGISKLTVFNKPLDAAMSPIFDHFKSLYDPIYSFLQKSVTTYTKGDSHNTKTNVIPLLLTLHHICSNIREYGMYRIININNDILLFLNHIIKHTEKNTNKEINKQLLTLPKVYLSTLFNKSNTYKPPTSIPYIQLFTYENNLNIQSNDLTKNTEINNQLKSFFNKKDVYILNNSSNTQLNKNIPITLYEIDFSKIDLYTPNIKINKLENNFLNTKTPDLFLDNLISLKNVTFNNAELALSIFIAFKEII